MPLRVRREIDNIAIGIFCIACCFSQVLNMIVHVIGD